MALKAFVKIFLLLIVCTHVQAQYYSFGQHLKYANASFENGEYLLAMEHYDKALQLKDNVNKDFIYNYAEAAYRTYSLNLAESLFTQYLEYEEVTNQKDVLFKLARIRQLQGRYEEAILDYNIHISEYGDVDSNLTKEVKFLKSSAQWAIDAYVVSIVDSLTRLPDSINSKFSEYAPFEFNDNLHYNSLRLAKEIDDRTLYHSRIFNENGEIAIEGSEGQRLVSHPSFSPDGKYLFYTFGDYVDGEKINCEIYFSLITEEGKIGPARRLGQEVNLPGYTATHPMVVSRDSAYTLYYVSDRPGGKGGLDIYAVNLSKEMELSQNRNLRGINTERDEMTPFLHERTSVMYFSSNGRDGYGDFDVYRSADYENDGLDVENMGNVINSANNDLFFFLNENGSKIYLSSNRPGSNYLDSKYETCCYDIYEGEVENCSVNLLALTLDAISRQNLNGCNVKIYEVDTDSLVFDQNSDSNIFESELYCERPYKIIASKEGYESAELVFAGDRVVFGAPNEIVRKLYLQTSVFDLEVAVYDEDTKLPLDSLDFIVKNLTTGDVIEVFKHPSNFYTFNIDPETDYEITVKRQGYIDKIETFNSGISENVIKKDIYLKEKEIIREAKVSLAKSIPVALFFDHDQPEKGVTEVDSPENFTTAHYKYYNKRANYVERYANRFKGERKDDALNDINSFFDTEVKSGFDKYEQFKKQLILVLESGQKINIYLRGYTSPIAPSEYNIALGRRRIDSVRREFDEWGGGSLLPYIQSGQLTITERSFGEETSPTNISDDPRQPSKSIYSPSASRERRVEIDEINFNQDK